MKNKLILYLVMLSFFAVTVDVINVFASDVLGEDPNSELTQKLKKTGGYAAGTVQNVNETIASKTNQYQGNVNETGGAYEQAVATQQNADSGSVIGKVVGGAMTAGGLTAIAVGTKLIETIWGIPKGNPTIAVGVMLVAMGVMEFNQSAEDDLASEQAGLSQRDLRAIAPTKPTTTTTDLGDKKMSPTYIDPSYDPKKISSGPTVTQGVDNSNLPGNANLTPGKVDGSVSLAKSLSQIEDNMASKLEQSGITFDKNTKNFTLPDGQTFTMKDVKQGKMPTPELQEAYDRAAAKGSEIAATALAAHGLNSDGVNPLGKGATNKEDSLLVKIAGETKDPSASGAGGSGYGNENITDAEGGGTARLLKSANDNSSAAAKSLALAGKVAGLAKNYNGELIGVSSDSIFEMVKRRYEMKDKENTFIIDNSI